MHTGYITAATSAARATEATTVRAGAASDWIVGAGVGASVGAEDRVGAVVGMCVLTAPVHERLALRREHE